MGKLMGSRPPPSFRGKNTRCTRQLRRLRIIFATKIDREGKYDRTHGFGLRGDGRLSRDDLGRFRCARGHTILRYLPGALPVQRQWGVLLLPSRLSRRISGNGQWRRNVGLRRDERQNDGSIVEPSQPSRCCRRRPYRMHTGQYRRDLPRRHVQCLRQDTRRSARCSASIADALSVD
jgi:hypothetical protein